MGNALEHQRAGDIPPHQVWLQNQTFRIKGQFYTLHNRRGGGAFGSVWASTMRDGHRAAVKVFDLRHLKGNIPATALADSFQEEVKMAYKLRDAKYHVVNIYGFDFDAERHVALMAMELGEDTLEDRAKNLHMRHQRHDGLGMFGNDYISPKDRKSIWTQLVQIVLVLGQHNIVHRDMKPANLVFFGPTLKIVDLGIAQKALAGYSEKKLGGTPYYSAPECMRGGAPVTSKADIWSAGAILYYLTYGQPPVFLSSQPPPGFPPTRSALVQDLLYRSLQTNQYQRPSHQYLAQHPLTAGPALA